MQGQGYKDSVLKLSFFLFIPPGCFLKRGKSGKSMALYTDHGKRIIGFGDSFFWEWKTVCMLLLVQLARSI